MNTGFLGLAVATVLTVYGIETNNARSSCSITINVATVLTVYGIETNTIASSVVSEIAGCNSTYRLRY